MKDYPKPDTAWFTESRFGMFIHWGIYATPARHEWVKNIERLSDQRYQPYFDTFEPDLYDPHEWASMAKAAGMRYVVITAKHHDGFCLWDTAHTKYKVTNTPHGKDLLKPFVDAFREAGLHVGFYYSLIDWHHKEFPVDSRHPQRFDVEYREANKNRDISKYAEYMRGQVRELMTDFGKIDVLWFDFSYPGEDGKGCEDWESEKLYALVKKLQPDILLNNRLDLPGTADIVTPEQIQLSEAPLDKDGNPLGWGACQKFSGSWGYHRDEMSWKSPKLLLTMLVDGVSKGGNLLLNVGPTARGEFDDRAVNRLDAFACWMHYNSSSIYACGPAPKEFITPDDCRYTFNPKTNRLYLHLFNWPFGTLHLHGLTGKIRFARFLHDGSEVRVVRMVNTNPEDIPYGTPEDAVTLTLPTVEPSQEVPVIEIILV